MRKDVRTGGFGGKGQMRREVRIWEGKNWLDLMRRKNETMGEEDFIFVFK